MENLKVIYFTTTGQIDSTIEKCVLRHSQGYVLTVRVFIFLCFEKRWKLGWNYFHSELILQS